MQTPRRDFWTPVAGVLAAVTFIVGLALVANGPESDDSDAEVLAWYAKQGHRVSVIIGVYVLAFCGLFLLWFASGLRERLRAAEGSGGRLSNVALGGAVVCVGLLYVGSFAMAAVPAGESLGGVTAVSDADVARFLPQMGFGAILVGAMFGAIALIDAASIVIYRSGILPRWLAWLGFVCALLLLFAAAFIPVLALPIWLIATSVVLFRTPATEVERSAAASAPPP